MFEYNKPEHYCSSLDMFFHLNSVQSDQDTGTQRGYLLYLAPADTGDYNLHCWFYRGCQLKIIKPSFNDKNNNKLIGQM